MIRTEGWCGRDHLLRLAPINANPRDGDHPTQRDVPLSWPLSFTCSGLAHETCGRCTHALAPEQCRCESSPRINTSSALLNDLKISWSGCESFGINSTDSNLQCAYLEVPMDYHDSSAGTARLAVAKYSATTTKLGTIFFNPGEPSHPSFVVLL